MNTTGKIGLTCFLGSFIGALLALQLGALWWIGSLIGGGVGYISYSFREVIDAMCCVAISLKTERMKILKVLQDLICHILYGIGIAILFVIFIISFVISDSLIVVNVANVFNTALGNTFSATSLTGIESYLYWTGGTLIMCVCTLVLPLFKGIFGIKDKVILRGIQCVLISLLPAVAFVTVPLTIFLFILTIIGVIGFFSVSITLRVVRLIHSDIRLLCMTDSLIGAIIGYYFKNPLVGALIGCILGVLNYQLVSIKWFKITSKSV